jgi:hypothetical protein
MNKQFIIKKRYPIYNTKQQILKELNSSRICRIDFITHILRYCTELAKPLLPLILSKCNENIYFIILQELDYVSFNVVKYCIENTSPNAVFEIVKLIQNPSDDILQLAIQKANSDNVKEILMLNINIPSAIIILGLDKLDEKDKKIILLMHINSEELINHVIKTTSLFYIEELVELNIHFTYANIKSIIHRALEEKNYNFIKILYKFENILLDFYSDEIFLNYLVKKLPDLYYPYLVVLYKNPTDLLLDIAVNTYIKNNIPKKYKNDILQVILNLYSNISEKLLIKVINYLEYSLHLKFILLVNNPTDNFLEHMVKISKVNMYEIFKRIKIPSQDILKYTIINLKDRSHIYSIFQEYNITRDFILLFFYESEDYYISKLFYFIYNPSIDLLEIALNKCKNNYNYIQKIFQIYIESSREVVESQEKHDKKFNNLLEKYIIKIFDEINNSKNDMYIETSFSILYTLLRFYIGEYSDHFKIYFIDINKKYYSITNN